MNNTITVEWLERAQKNEVMTPYYLHSELPERPEPKKLVMSTRNGKPLRYMTKYEL